MNHETQHLEYKKEWRTDFPAELAGMANAKGITCRTVTDKGKSFLE